jgi:hypothetical protein
MKSNLLAPNGKPSNLTAEQYKLVRTPEFKAWFGDWENDPANASKVVDENGEPLVVYHGTPFDFTIFKKDKPTTGAYGQGFYLTNDKGFASNYARSNDAKILNCFLDVRKIFVIDNDKLPNGYEKYSNMVDNKGVSRDFTRKIISENYDGVYAQNKYNENEFVVFEPTQIKLADGTNTTFNASSPDIRYDDGGEVEDLINKGVVELKMYETTPEHAREYGIGSINPLYIQTICVNNDSRLKGIGKKVLAYIDEYARKNGNDVVFGHITQKAEFTKDERQNFFCDIDLIKNWLYSNGYAINNDNNDFHKVIQKNVRYNNGGEMKKVDKGGITYGNSHDEGGIPVKNASTGQMLEVEGGEGIVNKRSMASDKMVKLNGKEMTICEAVSHLNQMEGGVRFSCDDVEHRQFIESMDLGGELERGKRTEKEHIDTLIKLYEKKLTPNEAVTTIAKEHIAENPTYYTDLSKMNKEEKRARIAELKRNFVEKAKQGTKVQDGTTTTYPKMNKYTEFFDTMSKYQDEYKKAVSAHEKTVTEGLRVKDDKKMPKKEKDAKLETLRQELIQDKTRLKEARQDLAKLPEMKSPFYAPKLAEGGQIVRGMKTFDRAMRGDLGNLEVKPIKDDVALYKLPKTGFTIDWAVNDDGTFDFISYIGKRSVIGNEVVVRINIDNYNKNVLKSDFLKMSAVKGNYRFIFKSEAQTPIYAVTKFINFLRFNGNQTAFFENYDPNTLSVYTKGGDSGKQKGSVNPIKNIADTISDDIFGFLVNTMGEEAKNKTNEFALNYMTLRNNLNMPATQDIASTFVNFKTLSGNPKDWYAPIYNLSLLAKDFITKWNLYHETEAAFKNAPDSPMKTLIVNEILPKLLAEGEIAMDVFSKAYVNKDEYAWKAYFNPQILEYLNQEKTTIRAIYFLYLIK